MELVALVPRDVYRGPLFRLALLNITFLDNANQLEPAKTRTLAQMFSPVEGEDLALDQEAGALRSGRTTAEAILHGSQVAQP